MSLATENNIEELKSQLSRLEKIIENITIYGDEQVYDDIKQLKNEYDIMKNDAEYIFPISGYFVDYELRKQLKDKKIEEAHKISKKYFLNKKLNRIETLEIDNSLLRRCYLKQHNNEMTKIKNEIKNLSESAIYTVESVNDPLTQYHNMSKRKLWLIGEMAKIVNKYFAQEIPPEEQKRMKVLNDEEINIYNKMKELQNNELKIQREIIINGKIYKIGKYYHYGHYKWALIVDETNNFYKIQDLPTTMFSEQYGSTTMKYEMSIDINTNLTKMSKKRISPVYIYEKDNI